MNERSKNPLLTEDGLELINQALPAVEAAYAQFFAPLTPEDMAQLLSLFSKLPSNRPSM